MKELSNEALPHWDLTNIYPSLESPEYALAVQQLGTQFDELEKFVCDNQVNGAAALSDDDAALAAVINGCLERTNSLTLLLRTLTTYTDLHVAVNSYNSLAKRKVSELEQFSVRMRKISVSFQVWLGKRAAHLPAVIEMGGLAASHTFYLQETAQQSQYLMSEVEESLAAELGLSGAEGWHKLQGTVCSQLTVPFERDGIVKKTPIFALVNLRGDPDPDVRRRAYETELEAWKTVREPLAAALNGIKGAAITLQVRRGRKDALHAAIDMARIDRQTLEAMLTAMESYFPAFRRYLKAKAARLGKPALPWYDLFAPLAPASAAHPTEKTGGKLSWSQAQEFVVTQFGRFSGELADFASNAFACRWIDAEPRDGKRGGAFCASLPGVEESRIMANFDGSLDQTFTIAHELGHGFHNYCMKGKHPLLRLTPMTLAETASTFCETIVTEAALSQASSPQEELDILETFLIGATQVILDVTSRYQFEKEVFERRPKAELSADDLCDIMLRAQKATYGDGLDERFLHPYMWTWKPHYYFTGLNFYNFPYAFGQMFGTGLYAIFEQRGPSFLPDYKALLASTGEGNAADLAARFGIDIRTPEFWLSSLAVIEKRINRYINLMNFNNQNR
ncbi:MAG TPA: M3 family oligoendopeptidase [Anaerolineaceae bacterium]